jgi:hypothetical protein
MTLFKQGNNYFNLEDIFQIQQTNFEDLTGSDVYLIMFKNGEKVKIGGYLFDKIIKEIKVIG